MNTSPAPTHTHLSGSEERPPEKHCKACGHDKPHSDFYRSTSRSDGLSTYCKDCVRASKRRQGRRSSPSVVGDDLSLSDQLGTDSPITAQQRADAVAVASGYAADANDVRLFVQAIGCGWEDLAPARTILHELIARKKKETAA